MENKDVLGELAAMVARHAAVDGMHDTAVKGLQCLRMSDPSAPIPAVYNPSLCVVVQGCKQVLLEDEVYHYRPTHYLAVSVDLPVLGQVVQASPAEPYLCVKIEIDPRALTDLLAQVGDAPAPSAVTPRGLFVGRMDDALLDAVMRLVRLLDTPTDVPVLAPMIVREIHYRLLRGEHGNAVAELAAAGSNMQRIAEAIRAMKSDLARQLRIGELAAMTHMSPSSFHHHFKAVTAMSPLQYQKRLRLTQARQILLSENADATSTAYRVGYESPSQFSREYARMFGAPPIRDVAKLRNIMAPANAEEPLAAARLAAAVEAVG
ncbi:MAG: AraC family transcriptional regulator [Gammaproteobacteria bacterium]|nr:AraC family transcriptional regulator [Gammaproteobacteria bacterium]